MKQKFFFQLFIFRLRQNFDLVCVLAKKKGDFQTSFTLVVTNGLDALYVSNSCISETRFTIIRFWS